MSAPTTPVLERLQGELHSSFSRSPRTPEMLEVKYKDYQSAIEAIQQLETELNEFQTSSYELEKELEKELMDLELKNEDLHEKVDELEEKLKRNKKYQIEKENEFSDLRSALQKEIEIIRRELSEKTSRLIDIEIANDNFEQNERNFESNQSELKEEYNKVLERNILLETEVSELKKLLLKEQLNNQNIQNELNDLRSMHKPSSHSRKTSNSSQTLPRSNSLLQLHSIRTQSKEMGTKLDNIKFSLQTDKISHLINFNRKSKADITTKLSNTHITTQTPGSATSSSSILTTCNDAPSNDTASIEHTAKKKIIPLSPNSFTLSSLIGSGKAKLNKMEIIKGSPNKATLKDNEEKIKHSKGRKSFGGLL
jgi:chromosome segregation ATPase